MPPVTAPPERQQIRFAEEIFTEEFPGDGKKAKKKRGGLVTAEDREAGKAKKPKRVRYEEVEPETDEYEEFVGKFKR